MIKETTFPKFSCKTTKFAESVCSLNKITQKQKLHCCSGSTMILPAHEFEILACDWNKYDDCIIATASVDKSIKVWDVRSYRVPVAVLNGHGYAVRKVKFSPHRGSAIASCSYDMTVCLWDYMVEDALIARYDHHTEFAVGVDMSVLVDGLMASTGWDELVYVWPHGTDPRAP